MKKTVMIMILEVFALTAYSQVQMKGKYDFRDTVQMRRTLMAKGGLALLDSVLHIRYTYGPNNKGFFFSDLSAHNFTFAPSPVPPTGFLTGYIDTSQANMSILVNGTVDMDPFHNPGQSYYLINVMGHIKSSGNAGIFTTIMQTRDGMELSRNHMSSGGWGSNLIWDSTFSITNYKADAYNGLFFGDYAGIFGSSTNRFSVFCHPDYNHFMQDKTSRIMLDTSFAVLGMGESYHWIGDYLSKLKLYRDSAVLTSSLDDGHLNFNKLKLTNSNITLGFAYDYMKMTVDSSGHHFSSNVEVGDTLICSNAPMFPKIFNDSVAPGIPENSTAFWHNTADSSNYLILNKEGFHRVSLDTAPVYAILKDASIIGCAWNTFNCDSMVLRSLDNQLANPAIFQCVSNKVGCNRDTLIITRPGIYRIEFSSIIHTPSWNLSMTEVYFMLRAGPLNGYFQVVDHALTELTSSNSTVNMYAVCSLNKGDRVFVQSMNTRALMQLSCGNTKLTLTKIN